MTRFSIALLAALALPLALLAANAVRNGRAPSLADLPLYGINWLFMAAPQLVVLAMALWSEPFRLGLATPVLAVLCALLLLVQGWVWGFVPGREGALAWVVYVPLWIAVLLLALGYHLLTRGRP